jgi:hypothetical protein
MDELPTMSWRKFQVLLRCLSNDSATVSKINAGQYIGANREKTVTVTSPKAAEAAFQAKFAKAPKSEVGASPS